MKRLKFFLVLAVVVLVFAFPQKARADSFSQIFFDRFDSAGGLYWQQQELYFHGVFTAEEKAYCVFENFFSSEGIPYVPPGVKLRQAYLVGDQLFLNVSEEILQYGGSYYELCLKSALVKTALDIPGVSRVTLLIENKLAPLPEGSLIEEETAWQDLTAERTTKPEK